jgi:hypothetical protein
MHHPVYFRSDSVSKIYRGARAIILMMAPVARRGFTLLALEFDRTVVGAQAGGARGGTAEALAARVRPLVAELIRQATATVTGPAALLQVSPGRHCHSTLPSAAISY